MEKNEFKEKKTEAEIKERNRKIVKGLLIALCVIESIILAGALFFTIWSQGKFDLIGRKLFSGGWSESEYNKAETNNPDIQGEHINPDDIDWGGPADQIGGGKNVINILLVGQDRREGEGRARSDSMILCTINKSAKTITMTSFMRDMYVQIPGYNDNRINASYAFGGVDLLNQCLNVNFGIVIDGNVEIDFYGFQDVIDMIGGLDIELTKAEADYLNRWGNWDVEDNAGQWNLVEGVNHLNGSQTLAYSRIREVGNGDYGRTNRQRIVLTKLIAKAQKMDIIEIDRLLNKLLPLVSTDMTNREIISLVAELLPKMSNMTVNTQQIPADGAHYGAYVREMAVLIPDVEKNREILAEIMAE